jgi:hypothetical protein
MKKIIISIAIVISGLFLLDGVFSFLIQENRNIKLSNAMKGSLDYDVIFHGPCEPLFTIDASVIDSLTGTSSYNYALRHTDFADNYLHLYLYLQANKIPKQVYLYVTPESFDLRFNTFHSYRFAPYLNDTLVAAVVKEMDVAYAEKTWFPFMRFAYYNSYKTFDAVQGFTHYWNSKTDPYFKDGFIAHPDNIYHTRPDGYIAPEHLVYAADYNVSQLTDSSLYYELYEERQTFNWDDAREKYLRKIFKLCESKGVKLFLYESTPYANSVSDQPNRQEFLLKTSTIAKEYQSKYILMDELEIGKDKQNFVCPLILSIKGTAPFLNSFSDSIKVNLLESSLPHNF